MVKYALGVLNVVTGPLESDIILLVMPGHNISMVI